jgi:hypothetical protein
MPVRLMPGLPGAGSQRFARWPAKPDLPGQLGSYVWRAGTPAPLPITSDRPGGAGVRACQILNKQRRPPRRQSPRTDQARQAARPTKPVNKNFSYNGRSIPYGVVSLLRSGFGNLDSAIFHQRKRRHDHLWRTRWELDSVAHVFLGYGPDREPGRSSARRRVPTPACARRSFSGCVGDD